MFGKKKLYEIVWKNLCKVTDIIAARNEEQALKIFYRRHFCVTSIISFREYKMEESSEASEKDYNDGIRDFTKKLVEHYFYDLERLAISEEDIINFADKMING